MKGKVILNTQSCATDYETTDKPSMTMPDQSMSLQEILNKFAIGQPTNDFHEGYYDNDPDIDNPDLTLEPDFDLVDADTIRANASKAESDLQDALKSAEQPEEKEQPPQLAGAQ